jgi:riboflavin synthase
VLTAVFTGIVSSMGTVATVEAGAGVSRIAVETGALATTAWKAGDSIAVSGVCLTAVAVVPGRFEADLSGETLARTTLGRLAPGNRVNLEAALAAGSALGGHFVTGHVDGIATVRECREEGGALRVAVETPAELLRFIAVKGSVTLDGVSLTVGALHGAVFDVHLVPHTRAVTTFGALAPGRSLNLEVDLLARYLDRLLEARGAR